jgi:hypothetical protein
MLDLIVLKVLNALGPQHAVRHQWPKTARSRDGELGADRYGAGRLLKLEG